MLVMESDALSVASGGLSCQWTTRFSASDKLPSSCLTPGVLMQEGYGVLCLAAGCCYSQSCGKCDPTLPALLLSMRQGWYAAA